MSGKLHEPAALPPVKELLVPICGDKNVLLLLVIEPWATSPQSSHYIE